MHFADLFVEHDFMSAVTHKSFDPLLPVLVAGEPDESPLDSLVIHLHQMFERRTHLRGEE